METHYHLVELAEEIVETANQAKENLLKTQDELEQQVSETAKLSKLSESLAAASDTVAAASSKLVEMEDLLLRGEYGKVLEGLEADAEARKQEMQQLQNSIQSQSAAISAFDDRLSILEGKIDNLITLASSIESWSDKIERIDKNAQKGFGKIKG